MNKIFMVLFFLLASACTLAPRPDAPKAIYDLGPQPTQHSIKQPLIKTFNLLVTETTSPIWLNSPAIHYRLSYHNPAQSYFYANSRWAAAPAKLLTQRVRNRIVTSTNNHVIRDASSAKADYDLHIELEEFTQVFDAIDNSRAVINLRANLVERRTRSLLAQRNFNIDETAPTADAPGAVHALTAASDKLIGNLIDWFTQELANQ